MPVDKKSVAEWQRLVSDYEGVIAKFERVRADLMIRRNGATDSVMVIIDERLKLNERMLKSMRQGLTLALDEIRRLEPTGRE